MAGAESFTVLAVLSAENAMSEVFAEADDSLQEFNATVKETAGEAESGGAEIGDSFEKAAARAEAGAEALSAATARAQAALAETAETATESADAVAESATASEVAMKSATAGYTASAAAAAQAGAALVAAQGRTAAAQDAYKSASAEAADETKALADAEAAAGAGSEEYAAQLGRTAAAIQAEADAFAELKAAQAEQAEAQTASTAANEEAGTVAGDTAAAGLGKYKMALLGVAVGAGVAVDAGMKFQKQTTTLVTSAGESASQLGMLQQGILKLSGATDTSASQLTSGLYMISSAGITGAGGLNVLKAAAQGAHAEGADLSTVTTALTSAMNAYGMKTTTAAEATANSTSMMNQMLATVSHGKMTFQQLAGSLSAVLPVAEAMTSMGVSAQQGTQELANAITHLSGPTSTMTNEMSLFGISSTTVAKNLGSKGLVATVQELSNAVTSKMGPAGLVIVNSMNQSKAAVADANTMLKQLPASIQSVAEGYENGTVTYNTWYAATKALPLTARTMATQFATVAGTARGFNDLLKSGSPAAQTYNAAMGKIMGTESGLNVALALTGAHAATAAKNVAAVSAAAGNTSAVSGFKAASGTLAFQLGSAAKSAEAAGTELGLALLPVVTAILKPLASMLGFIAGNKAAAYAFAAVVGTVLAGALGMKLAGALKDGKKAIEETVEGIDKLVKKIQGWGSAQGRQAAGAKEAGKASEEASADSAAAAETAAGEQEAASGEAAAAAEADAAATAAANDEAAAGSSASWIASAAAQVAAGAVWVAQTAAKVAVIVASNVAGAASTLAAWVAANAAMTLGIGLIVLAVVAAVALIVTHWKQVSQFAEAAFHDVLAVIDAVISWVKSNWPILLGILLGPIALAVALIVTHWKLVEGAAAGVIDWVKSHWPLLLEIITGPIGAAVLYVVDHFGQLRAGAGALVNDFVGFFESIPGRIVSALGNLGSLLFGSGEKIVQGLINGVTSMVGDVGHAAESVVDEIKSFLPFSPAKKGPLSGAGDPSNSGKSIALLLASGMLSGKGAVSAATAQLAGAAGLGHGTPALPAAGAAGAGGSGVTVNLTIVEPHIMSDSDMGKFINKLGPALAKALGQAGVKIRMK